MLYKLSATLAAHTADVRALSSPTNELVLSVSRDSTAIVWQRSSADPTFKPEHVLKAGRGFVNSVAYIPPSADASKGYAVTGGQDTVINVFSLESPSDDPTFSLLGHTDNVCALTVSPGGAIISGSWDKTAKVWKDFKLAYDLKGHEASVWAVLAVDEERSLTGSADKTIKLWQQHKVLATFTGHKDAVRGLALVPEIGFASCSNDSEIRVWTLGGDHVYSLNGHTSFVYSLSVLPSGEVVSGGEDRSVRIWKDGDCYQVIVHPAISVWAVSTMPNGDIVTGCSDHVVRVFSASEDRWASEADQKEYDDKVASQSVVTEEKISSAPGPEALNIPGNKPGEVKMIKNAKGVVEAYMWDNNAFKWNLVGVVSGAAGAAASDRKKSYQGKEYDYVFDVDIQEGAPPLKLPYNVSENPFAAAQRFLESNDLPLTYLDEVVHFIETNTAGVSLGTGGEEYVDPFTGASRYRSNPNSVPASHPSATYMDPYTGASRYSGAPPPSGPAASVASSAYMDPFTGASRYSGAPQPSDVKPPSVLPVPKPILFLQAKVSGMQNKVHQFDQALSHEISTSTLAMYPEERLAVDQAFDYLAQAIESPSPPPSPLTADHIDSVIHILRRWPVSQLFPVIDLSRLLTGFSPHAFDTPGLKDRFFTALLEACEWRSSRPPPTSKAHQTNALLLFRTIANIFQDGTSIEGTWIGKVLQTLSQAPYASLNANQRVALSTILFNISCIALLSALPPDTNAQHLTFVLHVIESESTESEAAYRALVALGNVVYAAKAQNTVFDATQSAQVSQRLASLRTAFPDEARIQNVTQEIAGLLL